MRKTFIVGDTVRLTEDMIDADRDILLLPVNSVVTISGTADDGYYSIEEVDGYDVCGDILDRIGWAPCGKTGETVLLLGSHDDEIIVDYECEILNVTCHRLNPNKPFSVLNEQFRYTLLCTTGEPREITVWTTYSDEATSYCMVNDENYSFYNDEIYHELSVGKLPPCCERVVVKEPVKVRVCKV